MYSYEFFAVDIYFSSEKLNEYIVLCCQKNVRKTPKNIS